MGQGLGWGAWTLAVADPVAIWFWPDMGRLTVAEVAAKRWDGAPGVLIVGLLVELEAVAHLRKWRSHQWGLAPLVGGLYWR